MRIQQPGSLFLTLMLLSIPLRADTVTLPHSFTAGTPAQAAQVNANFSAVKTAVDDNHERIEALEAQVAALQAYIAELQSVMALQMDAQGNPALVFSGVNVHVNNGAGSTLSINGLGNLIIGYDEPTISEVMMCSLGQYDDQIDCEGNGALWQASHKSGSHNLIVGTQHNYSRSSGFAAGLRASVTGDYASVTGGVNNKARGEASHVAGGTNNSAAGSRSNVSGGLSNVASGINSNVSGGSINNAIGAASSVSGGGFNDADGANASISGGVNNLATGEFSSVGGGNGNMASGERSAVSGGSSRSATGQFDWVAGGLFQDN